MTGRSATGVWPRVRLVVAVVLVIVAATMLRRSVGQVLESEVASGGGILPDASSAPARLEARPSEVAVRLVEVAGGFDRPLFATHAGDGSGRLFVVEQGGRVRILAADGRVLPEAFLDLSAEIDTSRGERGLLGLAFAPDERRSGRLFVSYTARKEVRVAALRVSPDPDRADPASLETVVAMDDPASNHNGGMIAFGPDGHLWIATGDGGAGGDPWNNAQDLGSLLGKILRIDVRERPYGIPPDNPFRGRLLARDEIWSYGLRNPWRFSFDRRTGELWIGDVGQNAYEEIDREDPAEGGGVNYGWRVMEGRHCFSPRQGCDTAGLRLPVHEYSHRDGCSVTGGYVYRGAAIRGLDGAYLFADYCRGTVWALEGAGGPDARLSVLVESGERISSFGEDEAGEVYLCAYGSGRLLRLAPPSEEG